jgi:hypothetical protein
MATPRKLEWQTSLGSIAQELVVAKDREVREGRYRPTDVQDHTDTLTVAELRHASAELDEELERLRLFTTRINELKERLKEVAAV